MDDGRPTRIEDLLGRAMFLGIFEVCFPVDIFETGAWLAEHERFPETLELASEFAQSNNHFSRFCFTFALERYAKVAGLSPAIAEAAGLFENDPDPHARKHAHGALALKG